MNLLSNLEFSHITRWGHYAYRILVDGMTCNQMEPVLEAAGVRSWNSSGTDLDIGNAGMWAKEMPEIDVALHQGQFVFTDAPLNILAAERRFVVYNPQSSLPITTIYKSEKQANKVARKMANEHNESFFIAEIVRGFVRNPSSQDPTELTPEDCHV